MRRRLSALLVCAAMLTALVGVPVAVLAASCTDGGKTVKGDVCGVVEGNCVCYDYPKK